MTTGIVYFRDWGISDTMVGKNITPFIEINSNLKNFPYAYKKTLEHEALHLKSKGKVDFFIELKEMFNLKLMWELLKFHFKYPKSIYQYLPITKAVSGRYAVGYYNIFLITMVLSTGGLLWLS